MTGGSRPRSKYYFRKKISVMKFVLFSVTLKASSALSFSSKLLVCFCCAKKAGYHKAD